MSQEDDPATFIAMAEVAFGFRPTTDELAWFTSEFRRTRKLMERARAVTPALNQVTPEDFAWLIQARRREQ